jgi:hypothetical protein
VNLRPLGTGELLDATIRLYRDNLRALVLIGAAVHLPIALVRVLFSGGDALGLGDVVAPLLELGVGFPVGVAAVTAFVGQRWLNRPASPEGALRDAFGRIGPILFGAFILAFAASTVFGFILLVVALPILGFAFVGMIAGGSSGAAAGALGGLAIAGLAVTAGVVAAAALYVRLAFWTQAVVLERVGPLEALSRSWGLTRGLFWPSFLRIFVLTLLYFVLLGITIVVFGTIFGAVVLWSRDIGGAMTQIALYQAAANVVLQPFLMTGFTLLYVDLRVRKEAFDLQMMAEEIQRPESSEAPER